MKYIIDENIKGLIFDFDGTIVDSMPVHYLSWSKAFEMNDVIFNEEFFYEKAGLSLVSVVEEYNKRYNRDLNAKSVAELKNKLHYDYISELKLIKPVFEVIKSYSNILPMAIATGSDRDITLYTIERLKIDKYFKGIVSADDVENSKPDPEVFLKAAELINIVPEQCEVFEDGLPGLEGARAAGMKATDIRAWLEN
jgi:HAD superfamily hydrolase (TIGR01509 family)